MKNEEKLATAIAITIARGRQDSGKSAVLVQAEQKRENNR